MTENGQVGRMLADAEAEIERLKAERDRLKALCECTYCAYCGFETHLSDIEAANEAITAHIAECEKHPMRAVEARCLKAKAERESLHRANLEIGTKMLQLEAERDRLREALKEGRLSYCACEDESKCDVCRLYDFVMQE